MSVVANRRMANRMNGRRIRGLYAGMNNVKALSSRRSKMKKWQIFSTIFVVSLISSTALGQARAVIKPQLILSEIVRGMPRGKKQEVRVLTANFQPGEKTLFHTHRFPVTVYVMEGTFTMEVEGREPLIVKAGQAMMMPTNVKMTGYNRSNSVPLRLVAFYMSDPGSPFLDPVH